MFKVGDKVRIRKDLDELGLFLYRVIAPIRGELATIDSISDGRYIFKVNGCCYCVSEYVFKRIAEPIESKKQGMTLNEYQQLAGRTIGRELIPRDWECHALHGMVGEIGELHSLYRKIYQGHLLDEEHLKKELGDLMWFIAEYCTAKGWGLSEIAELNIEKLKKRYPKGFEAEKSLNRAEGDI